MVLIWQSLKLGAVSKTFLLRRSGWLFSNDLAPCCWLQFGKIASRFLLPLLPFGKGRSGGSAALHCGRLPSFKAGGQAVAMWGLQISIVQHFPLSGRTTEAQLAGGRDLADEGGFAVASCFGYLIN